MNKLLFLNNYDLKGFKPYKLARGFKTDPDAVIIYLQRIQKKLNAQVVVKTIVPIMIIKLSISGIFPVEI